jgi:ABC-type multidrug transport system ATPase subunit
VQQQDVFYSQMTVRETIELAATLRLPNTVTAKDRLEV